jgi:hypothetical protein
VDDVSTMPSKSPFAFGIGGFAALDVDPRTLEFLDGNCVGAGFARGVIEVLAHVMSPRTIVIDNCHHVRSAAVIDVLELVTRRVASDSGKSCSWGAAVHCYAYSTTWRWPTMS